jgi:hypothetical protein
MKSTLHLPRFEINQHKLQFEFKDYPESALYMIGAIGEAKGKPKPATPADQSG